MNSDADRIRELEAKVIGIISVLKVFAQDIRAKDPAAPEALIARAEEIAGELTGKDFPFQNRAAITIRGDIFGYDPG